MGFRSHHKGCQEHKAFLPRGVTGKTESALPSLIPRFVSVSFCLFLSVFFFFYFASILMSEYSFFLSPHISLSISLCLRLCQMLSLFLPWSFTVCLSVCLFLSLSFRLSVCVSLCLPVSLFLSHRI